MKFKEKQIPAIPVQVCPKNSEHCNVQNLQLSAKKFLHVQWLEEKGRHRQKYKTRVKTNPTCLVIKPTGFGNDISHGPKTFQLVWRSRLNLGGDSNNGSASVAA